MLNRLADYTEQRQASRQKIQLAAIYPIILTFVCIGIVGFFSAMVPDIIKVFINNGQKLLMLTEVMLALSDWTVKYGLYVLVVLVAGGFGFKYMMTKPAFRLQVHRQMLYLPFIKNGAGTNTARFASTLSILNSSGVPLVEALRISAEVLSNQYLKQKVADASQKVREGASLHKSLSKPATFLP